MITPLSSRAVLADWHATQGASTGLCDYVTERIYVSIVTTDGTLRSDALIVQVFMTPFLFTPPASPVAVSVNESMLRGASVELPIVPAANDCPATAAWSYTIAADDANRDAAGAVVFSVSEETG